MSEYDAAVEAAEIVKLLQRMGVPPRLRDWGVTEKGINVMAGNAMLDHCHPRNPRPCSMESMKQLLVEAF